MAKRFKEKHADNKRKYSKGWILLLIFIIAATLSSIKIVKWYLDNKENQDIVEEISEAITIEETQEGMNKYTIDFEILKGKNPDTVAFLKVNGTNIEFPVVKTENNNFYLTHNFKKEYNKSGWIFTDYKNKLDGTDKNIVIYGHNTKSDTMFTSLKYVIKEDWYNNENNYKLLFATEQEYAMYEVFSVYKIEKENYYIKTNFKENAEFEEFIKTIKNRSIKDFGVEVSEKDSILTLSTCANNNKYRIVLHAKKCETY